MGLGKKEKFTGTVKKQVVNKGSKREHNAVVLDTGDGRPVKLRIMGNNPFTDPALEKLVGMRVTFNGVAGSGVHQIMIEKESDITVLGPAGRPAHPPKP